MCGKNKYNRPDVFKELFFIGLKILQLDIDMSWKMTFADCCYIMIL